MHMILKCNPNYYTRCTNTEVKQANRPKNKQTALYLKIVFLSGHKTISQSSSRVFLLNGWQNLVSIAHFNSLLSSYATATNLNAIQFIWVVKNPLFIALAAALICKLVSIRTRALTYYQLLYQLGVWPDGWELVFYVNAIQLEMNIMKLSRGGIDG